MSGWRISSVYDLVINRSHFIGCQEQLRCKSSSGSNKDDDNKFYTFTIFSSRQEKLTSMFDLLCVVVLIIRLILQLVPSSIIGSAL